MTYGLYNAQDRGTLFLNPGTPVYGGMVVGCSPKGDDIVVNVCKRKHITNVRASGSDEALRLTPPRIFSLEESLEFIEEDELVEVTPKSIRIRKRILDHQMRLRSNAKNKQKVRGFSAADFFILLISQNAFQGFIAFHPIFYLHHPVAILGIPDIHGLDAGVYDHTLAHGTAGGILDILPGFYLNSREIQTAAEHFMPWSADDGIGLGVHTAAKLVALAPGICIFPGCKSRYPNNSCAPGRADIAGGNDLVIFHDDSAIQPSKASARWATTSAKSR